MKKIRRRLSVLTALVMVFCLTACSAEESSALAQLLQRFLNNQATTEATKDSEPQTPAPTDPATPAPTEPITPAPTEPQTPAPTEPQTPAPTAPNTPAPTEPRPTPSASEKPTDPPEVPITTQIETFLNQSGVNGLLQSAYRDVRAALLFEVIYQMKDETVDGSKVPSYYQAAGLEYDDYSGVTYITGANLDIFLKSVTGYGKGSFTDDDVYQPVYFERQDLYCIQHGDTNFQPAEVLGIEPLEDGSIVAFYKNGWGGNWFFTFSGGEITDGRAYHYATEMRATVRQMADGSFRLISNYPLIMEDQSDPTVVEVQDFLNRKGFNGILGYRFRDVSTEVLADAVIYQMDEDPKGYKNHAELYKAYKVEYYDDTGCSGAYGPTIDRMISTTTGTSIYSLKRKYSQYFGQDDYFAIQHGDTNYQKAEVVTMIGIDDGFLVRYKDAWGGNWYARDLQMDRGYFAELMQAYIVYNEIGQLQIKTNLPMWYESMNDNGSLIIQPIMLQYNEFGVNGLLQSVFDDPARMNLGKVVAQKNDRSLNYDWVALFKKNGKTYEEGPGVQAIRGQDLDAFLYKYTLRHLDQFREYKNQYSLYLASEDIYTSREGGVTYQPISVYECSFDGAGNYFVTYGPRGDMSDNFYFTRNGEWGYATTMMAYMTMGPNGEFVVQNNQVVR